jgi:hypothetical protein
MVEIAAVETTALGFTAADLTTVDVAQLVRTTQILLISRSTLVCKLAKFGITVKDRKSVGL